MRQIAFSYAAALAVEGYGPGFFRLGPHVLRGPSLITPWNAGPWGGLDDAGAPLALAGEIDVLLLGMGDTVAYPPKAFREALEAAGIGVDPMTSPAACRTYNLLLTEGRRIAAAVLPVS